MNTPEQAGAALARDMIALVESHFQLNDERMIASGAMLGAFLYIDEHLLTPPDGEAYHDAFSRVIYPYMRERIKNAVRLTDEGKKLLLEGNAIMHEVYGLEV